MSEKSRDEGEVEGEKGKWSESVTGTWYLNSNES